MRLSTPDKVLAALGQMTSPGGTTRAELALDRSFHLLESILETKLSRIAQVDTFDVRRESGLPLRLRLTNRFVDMSEDVKPLVYSKPSGMPLENLSVGYLVPEDNYTIDPVEGVLSMHSYELHSGRNSLAIQYRSGFLTNAVQPEMLDVPFELENLAIQGAVLELNTADANKEVVIDLYRVAINPAKDLSVIGTDLMKFELSGQVLADLTKPSAGALGQFGRIVLL